MSSSVDLDNLSPDPATVRIGGKDFELQPPNLRQLLAITKLSERMDAEELSPEELDKAQERLKQELYLLCPGLEAYPLNGMQILALANTVAEMSQPKQEPTEDKGEAALTATPKDDTASPT